MLQKVKMAHFRWQTDQVRKTARAVVLSNLKTLKKKKKKKKQKNNKKKTTKKNHQKKKEKQQLKNKSFTES